MECPRAWTSAQIQQTTQQFLRIDVAHAQGVKAQDTRATPLGLQQSALMGGDALAFGVRRVHGVRWLRRLNGQYVVRGRALEARRCGEWACLRLICMHNFSMQNLRPT